MPSVLITGASRGIGRACAEQLAVAGWDVYAGVRTPVEFEHPRITAVTLDITDADQIAALDAVLPARLDGVVNNAGIVVDGPIEAIPPADLLRQFEVNVVGQAAVTQAVLPRIRAARGRIVFVSSMSGRVSTPLLGAYTSSKFALEALADAMRMELRPWGIRVVLVEPNSTDTDMWRGALDQADVSEAKMAPEHRRLYAGHIAGLRKLVATVQKQTVPVANVVDAVYAGLAQPRPRSRYPVGLPSKVQGVAARVTPTLVMDRVLSLAHGLPRKLD